MYCQKAIINVLFTGMTRRAMPPHMETNPVDDAVKEIEDFLARTGMKESRLGLLACANPRAVERVRDGSARVETLRALVEFVRREPR